MKKTIKLTQTYDYPVADVWNALTDKDALSEWLMPCDIKPIIGHKFQFKTKSFPGFNGIIDCVILELKEEELLSFSWSGGSLKNTKVVFRLTSENGKTRLDFEHSGFEGFLNKLIVRRILSNGWKSKILTILLPKFLSKNE